MKQFLVIGLGRFGASIAKTLYVGGESVLAIDIEGEVVQFQLIFRNHLTGSLFQALQDCKDTYGLDLPSNLK